MLLGRLLRRALDVYTLLDIRTYLAPLPLPQPDWSLLKEQVDGRLFQSTPYADPCFSQSIDSPECVSIQTSYVEEETRAHHPSAYIQTQWEACQATSEQCLLDHNAPDIMHPELKRCAHGSIPSYFINIQKPADVVAAFNFSKTTKAPLVIKNTGHDYKGRSSAPSSLALWMTFDPEFMPEGCSSTRPGMTVGAGVQWGEAYKFAEEHNFTIVGGADKTVGVAGGWLQGGGHSALSNTMGLGVDRVLQFKIVTPDGQYRIANECQNEDLFFALRGGGGGTFGVVMEASILTSPPVTLQVAILKFSPNTTVTQELWSVMANNGLKWASDGWGGFSMADVLILANPRLSKGEAAESLSDLIDFGDRLRLAGVVGFKLILTEFPSWGAFFDAFTRDHVATVGSSLALASRLVSKSNFATLEKRNELVSALVAANAATPGLIILMTAPSSVPSSGMTSVTEAWRSSLYHVTVIAPWNWNTTKAEKKSRYGHVSASIDNLRRITPDAAYLNEADVYEPNHQVAFWGTHYPELLRIKQKYDPDHLLDCWHCVGWNPKSQRFSCYL
ncbi:FAD-binding domain-containing protein [Flammula alnicola]|nr:FAD-binding domain-containing protein [Flammula alnicola]